MSQHTGKRKRVPVALHSELTEYSSLIRALRTQHTLDLSSHLSQLPSQSSLSQYGESELSLSQSEAEPEDEEPRQKVLKTDQDKNEGEGNRDRLTESDQEESDGNDGIDELESSQSSQEAETTQSRREAGKKRKKPSHDLWTRWPLLSGDIYPPEFGLEDEVQSIASRVLRQHRNAPLPEGQETTQGTKLESDEELEELDGPVARALAASTAHHLRSLLSACAAMVPCVEPSLRNRLAPLDWTSVLRAAATTGLVSPEILERVGSRLEALYGYPSAPSESVQRLVHSASAARAARERLNSLYEERIEQGDGDFLSFVGPPKKPKKKKNARNRSKEEEEADLEDGIAKT